jgi:hypothetical protein
VRVIDHDRLFKQLLSVFFLEFLDLFAAELVREIEPGSVAFLEKETFTDAIAGEHHVLRFRFRMVQLNRLSWRNFVRRPNPVAAALMARMRIGGGERAHVKVECLRLLATLRLDRAKARLIAAFVETYLRLHGDERKLFDKEMRTLTSVEREDVMEFYDVDTLLKEIGREEGRDEGRKEGRHEGRHEEAFRIVLRLLGRRLDGVPEALAAQVGSLSVRRLERLGEDLLDFNGVADLEQWLNANRAD